MKPSFIAHVELNRLQGANEGIVKATRVVEVWWREVGQSAVRWKR
jgi:hypothetical protein